MEGVRKQLPLIVMIFIQFVYTAMFLLSKAAISSGMKPSVFVVYRQAIAFLTLAPFVYFYERRVSSRLTFKLLGKIFFAASFGMATTLNLHYVALNYVSATFVTAVNNAIPGVVFILAVCLRIENLDIRRRHGVMKVVGTVVALSGAMVFTFYKGPALYSGSEKQGPNLIAKSYTRLEWIKGSVLTLCSNVTWALWLIMQGPFMKEYPAKLRLTALQCGFCCLVTAVYGAVVERDASSWKLGWNVNLLTLAYCGIVVTAISYTMQVWVVGKRGALYTSVFTPLPLLLTAIFSALLFHESLHYGSALGGVMLVGGLYAFLWGKNKEAQQKSDPQKEEAQQKSDPQKDEAHLEFIHSSKSPTGNN